MFTLFFPKAYAEEADSGMLGSVAAAASATFNFVAWDGVATGASIVGNGVTGGLAEVFRAVSWVSGNGKINCSGNNYEVDGISAGKAFSRMKEEHLAKCKEEMKAGQSSFNFEKTCQLANAFGEFAQRAFTDDRNFKLTLKPEILKASFGSDIPVCNEENAAKLKEKLKDGLELEIMRAITGNESKFFEKPDRIAQ